MSKIGIVFPGQGSQFTNMGEDFYNESSIYKETFDKVFAYDINLKDKWQDEEAINLTENAQPLLFANQVAILEVIKNTFDIKDEAYAGFSLGEYSALLAAGTYDFNQGIEIVNTRAKLMGDVKSDYNTRVVIGKTKDELEEIISGINEKLNTNIIISNYNLEKQLLINYPQSDENEIISNMQESGVKRLIEIKVSGPFHTAIYDEASKKFYDYLKGCNLNKPEGEIYLNYTANKYDGSVLETIMQKQMTNGVLWYDLIQKMIEDGIDTFVEVGSKSILGAMIKKIDRSVSVISIEKMEDLNKLEDIWTRK